MDQYVEFNLISSKDKRIYLKGDVNIDTIQDDEPEFEYEQNDGTFSPHLPQYWKTSGNDLSDKFEIFLGNIDWEMLNQYLYDFQDEKTTVNFYGDILQINGGDEKTTTIRVKQSTKIKLAAHGIKGESFDDIINKLLKNQIE